MAIDLVRFRQDLPDRRDPFLDHKAAIRFAEYDRELIPTDPRNLIARPASRPQAVREHDENIVARRMTEPVVHRLKVVEIQHRNDEFPICATGDTFIEHSGESPAVVQAGECIGIGLRLQLALKHEIADHFIELAGNQPALEDRNCNHAGCQRDQPHIA